MADQQRRLGIAAASFPITRVVGKATRSPSGDDKQSYLQLPWTRFESSVRAPVAQKEKEICHYSQMSKVLVSEFFC